MLDNLAKRMVCKAAIVNMHTITWQQSGGKTWNEKPEDKFECELHGMELALDDLGIDYNWDFDGSRYLFKALHLGGKTYPVT